MDKKIEELEVYFDKRFKKKKRLNLLISILIIGLSIFALTYMQNIDREGILIFRWMTVDATIFTLILTFFFFIVNIIELLKNTELTKRTIYFTRLSSAVAEALIVIVVLISQLPIFPMHLHLKRIDMFFMHIVIPLMVIISFALNDSPIGKLSKLEKLYGTSYMTFYAVNILYLISEGIIVREKIPYSFLDIKSMSIVQIILTIVLFYTVCYGLSALLSFLNRKLYWLWFKRSYMKKGS